MTIWMDGVNAQKVAPQCAKIQIFQKTVIQ